MALEAFQCCGSESHSVDSVVEVQMVVYCMYYTILCEHVAALYAHVYRGNARELRVCVYSRVSLSNEDDCAALGGGEERQQPQGGRGEGNMCL